MSNDQEKAAPILTLGFIGAVVTYVAAIRLITKGRGR
jgi:hypothetical protein